MLLPQFVSPFFFLPPSFLSFLPPLSSSLPPSFSWLLLLLLLHHEREREKVIPSASVNGKVFSWAKLGEEEAASALPPPFSLSLSLSPHFPIVGSRLLAAMSSLVVQYLPFLGGWGRRKTDRVGQKVPWMMMMTVVGGCGMYSISKRKVSKKKIVSKITIRQHSVSNIFFL